MAKKLVYKYTFTPGGAGAGTIVVNGNWKERSLLLITNVTDNIIIYNFAQSGLGGSTSYSATTNKTTITLDYDTSSMSASDELQIFVDQEYDEVEFGESFVDPVHKLRVSTPENLIDTDFEYGLQSTKWETLELVNNIPSIYSTNGGVSIGQINNVSAINGSDLITVTCGVAHDLSVGDPIEVQGLNSRTAEGKYLVTNVQSTLVFSYKASAVQSTTGDIKTAYVTVIPGTFFAASDITYNVNESLTTNNANPSTITFNTDYSHGISTSTSLYITNTVGKKTFSISTTSGAAADGDAVVRLSDSSLYLPKHNLYNNQRIYITPTGSGAVPSVDAGAPSPTDDTTINAVYESVKTACDSIQSTMGSDASRIYTNYSNSSSYAFYTYSNLTNVSTTDGGDNHYQYLQYGDYAGNSAMSIYLYGSSTSYYNWSGGMSNEGADLLYTGSPIDYGSYIIRYSGSLGDANLANKGLYWQNTPYVAGQYTPYIIQVKQFPDPATMGDSSFNRYYYFDYSYQTKRYVNSTSYTSIYNTTQNIRQSAGSGWYYTYGSTYHRPSNPYLGYIKLDILLENDNWSGQYHTGNSNWSQYYFGNTYTFYHSHTTQKGAHYRIEVLLPIDDDATYTKYGTSGTTINTATMVSTIVNQIVSDVSYPQWGNPTGINTVFTKVLNSNRIQIANSISGSTYTFAGVGTAPLTVETDQTTGVLDDYYTVSGVTTSTVSIGSSVQISPRILNITSTTGIQTYNDVSYIYYEGGHGLSNGQKVVFDVVTGTTITGLTSGTTYYAIVADDQYVGLATDVTSWQSSTSGIATTGAAPASESTYKLSIYSIAGRVAAAGTIGITSTAPTVVNGYNTKFTSNYRSGDQFVIKGQGTPATYLTNTIASVVNDTKLELLTSAGITTSNANHYLDTKVNVRSDGTFIHRPFDGGVEITAGTSPNSSIVRQTRKYFRYQSGKGIQCSIAINFNPFRPVRLVEGVGTAVTMTTEYPHGLGIGNTITVQGASDSAYNGTYDITASTDFTFSYTAGSSVSEANPTGFTEYAIAGYENAAVRCGLFDFQNGFFYEYDGNTLYAVRRSSVQQIPGRVTCTKNSNIVVGSNTRFNDVLSDGDMIVLRGQSYKVTDVVSNTEIHIQPKYRGISQSGIIATKTIDTRVAQSSWSIDSCDGTGPSAYTLDVNKIQMAYFDYSWYGAGKIRFGFKDTVGRVRYVHEFVHNNKQNEAYMRSGNIAARYEVVNTGIPTFVPSILHWGTSVIMDGRYDNDDSYLFTASGNTLTFTNGNVDTATTNAAGSIYRQRVYGSYSNYYLRLSFPVADASKFSAGIPLYTSDGELNGETVSFTGYGSSTVFYVYIFLADGYQTPAVYPNVPNATAVSIGGLSAGSSDVDLNSLIPLISVRLGPSVDSSLVGAIGERDIINRMQLKLKELGISSSHNSIISVILNGNLSNISYSNIGSPSLSQYIAHSAGDTVDGGTTIYKFRASGGTEDANGKRLSEASTFDLEGLSDLGNSILGGDGVFPNGPDVMTICATPVDSSEVTATSAYIISSRVSWSESQA